jgi:hypothetical protein
MFALHVINHNVGYPVLVAVAPSRATLETYISNANARWDVFEQVRKRVSESMGAARFPKPAPVLIKLGFTPKTKKEHQVARDAKREYNKAISDYRAEKKRWFATQRAEALLRACTDLGVNPIISTDIFLLFCSTPFSLPSYTINPVTLLG